MSHKSDKSPIQSAASNSTVKGRESAVVIAIKSLIEATKPKYEPPQIYTAYAKPSWMNELIMLSFGVRSQNPFIDPTEKIFP